MLLLLALCKGATPLPAKGTGGRGISGCTTLLYEELADPLPPGIPPAEPVDPVPPKGTIRSGSTASRGSPENLGTSMSKRSELPEVSSSNPPPYMSPKKTGSPMVCHAIEAESTLGFFFLRLTVFCFLHPKGGMLSVCGKQKKCRHVTVQ